MSAEVEHSPLPWKLDKGFACEVLDRCGTHIFTCTSQYSHLGDEKEAANAAFVLTAVNYHDALVTERDRLAAENGTLTAKSDRLSKELAKLHEIACGLTKSRDAALKDADRLRALVRRFMGIVNNYPPIMSAWALLDAEEPAWRKLPAEKQAAMVPEGYKRLAALMRAAYRTTGEKEEEE